MIGIYQPVVKRGEGSIARREERSRIRGRKIITAAALCAVLVICILIIIEKRGTEDGDGRMSEIRKGEQEDIAEAGDADGAADKTGEIDGTEVDSEKAPTENEDGTLTLTVCAVCDMVICDDAVITHELTVQFEEDGSFRYLGNRILDEGEQNIPEYQYRIKI